MRAGADAVFVSPVFATASHPGAPTLGPMRFGLLAKRLPLPVIALGGMDARRFRRLKPLGAHGWAAIDALSPQRQKRKAVPT
jgi:thiamine-phosphate pyrophosphorylase